MPVARPRQSTNWTVGLSSAKRWTAAFSPASVTPFTAGRRMVATTRQRVPTASPGRGQVGGQRLRLPRVVVGAEVEHHGGVVVAQP